jgi:hypothetical protein
MQMESHVMKQRLVLLVALAVLAAVASVMSPAPATTGDRPAPQRVRGTGEIPGYPVWQDASLTPADDLR